MHYSFDINKNNFYIIITPEKGLLSLFHSVGGHYQKKNQ